MYFQKLFTFIRISSYLKQLTRFSLSLCKTSAIVTQEQLKEISPQNEIYLVSY